MEKAALKLESTRTILRLANEADVPAIVRYYTENQAHLAAFEPKRDPDFYTENYWLREVQAGALAFQTDRALKLFLFIKKNPKAIAGSINFANFIRGVFQSCTLGYSIAAAQQGQGYMSEALRVAIAYVFNELNMHRIIAAYLPYNQRSGILKRLGFVV